MLNPGFQDPHTHKIRKWTVLTSFGLFENFRGAVATRFPSAHLWPPPVWFVASPDWLTGPGAPCQVPMLVWFVYEIVDFLLIFNGILDFRLIYLIVITKCLTSSRFVQHILDFFPKNHEMFDARFGCQLESTGQSITPSIGKHTMTYVFGFQLLLLIISCNVGDCVYLIRVILTLLKCVFGTLTIQYTAWWISGACDNAYVEPL